MALEKIQAEKNLDKIRETLKEFDKKLELVRKYPIKPTERPPYRPYQTG